MSGQVFQHWLQRFLSAEGHAPVPYDGLNQAEIEVVQLVEKECRKADTVKQYSNAFLQTLDSTQQFSEVAIRALSALTKIGYLGETVRNINDFCMHIAEIFTHELGFENCSILLKDAPDGNLRSVASSAKGDKYPSAKEKKKSKVLICEDIARQVAGSGEHIFIPDVSSSGRCPEAGAVAGNKNISSLLAVPVKSGDAVLGVINCSHPLPGTFDENKINLILLLSNFAGQVITLITLHNKIAAWNDALREEVMKKTAELRKKNAKLHKLAVTDPLTGIFNRRFFFTRLEEEFSRTNRYNEQFALLLIDLDNLKAINDTYGHTMGDKVIRRIAKCLHGSVRKGDVVGRLGGDEFGYIMVNADDEAAHVFSLRLQEALRGVVFNGLTDQPTMSIGIVGVVGAKFKKYEDAYAAADNALYTAKKKRNAISVFGRKRK